MHQSRHEELSDVLEDLFDDVTIENLESLSDSQVEDVLDELADRAPTTGYVVYDGPSKLDGSHIVAIVTLGSVNAKTGDMHQLYILPADEDPLEALQGGNNRGVCGDCSLQGTYDEVADHQKDRVCYVNIGHAPMGIWRAWRRGRYPMFAASIHREALIDHPIRLGAYGDPAALPLKLLRQLAGWSSIWTGYTHQAFWQRKDRAEALSNLCMISCENLAQYNEARRRGWRSFVVLTPSQPIPDGCVECPYYTHGVQCIDCNLCDGGNKTAKSIAVRAHAKTGSNLPIVQKAVDDAVASLVA